MPSSAVSIPTNLNDEVRCVLSEVRSVTALQRRMTRILTDLLAGQRCMATAIQQVATKLDDRPRASPVESMGEADYQPNATLSQWNGPRPDDEPQVAPRMSTLSEPSRLSVLSSSHLDDLEMNNQDEGSFIAHTLPLSWPAVLPLRRGLRMNGERKLPQDVLLRCRPLGASDSSLVCKQRSIQTTLERQGQNYVIAPGSHLHMAFALTTFLVLVYDLMTVPVLLAWDIEPQGIMMATSWLSVTFWTMDMGFSFCTGYYIGGELQTSMAAIAKRYLMTWFSLDFVSVVGDWTSLLIQTLANATGDPSDPNRKGIKMLRIVKAGRLLRIAGVLRLVRFLVIVQEFLEKQISGSVHVVVKTISLLCGTLLLLHTISCAWFALGRNAPSDTGVRWTGLFEGGLPSNSMLQNEMLYQYITSFHWAAAQLTLGAADVPSTNTIERVFTILCMLLGLLFGCTLVSSFSVAMVEFQMAHKDQNQQIKNLRHYLKGNSITATTCMLVQDQVKERMHESRRLNERMVAGSVNPVLRLLSSRAYTRLRVEVFQPLLNSHPFLHLCSAIHVTTFERLCRDAVEFLFLQQGDELFAAGSVANDAYFVVSGRLEYTQRPDSSAVGEEISTTTSEGTWLCEAALWCEWVHVGTAVAHEDCKLVAVNAEAVIEAMSRHRVMACIASSYGETFYSRIISAKPPEVEYPTDLGVPHTSFPEIAIDMNQAAQVAIGVFALSTLSRNEVFGIRSYVAHALNSGPHDLEVLEHEVKTGKAVVILNDAGEIELVHGLAQVQLQKGDGEILVQVGTQGEHGIAPEFHLPSAGWKRGMGPSGMLDEVLRAKVPLLAGRAEYLSSFQEAREDVSRRFNVPLRLLRVACSARLCGEFEAPVCRLIQSSASDAAASPRFMRPPAGNSPPPRDGRKLATPESGISGLPSSFAASADALAEGLWSSAVYALPDQSECINFYTWLRPEVFKMLRTPAYCKLVKYWVSQLDFNQEDAELGRVCPGDLTRGSSSIIQDAEHALGNLGHLGGSASAVTEDVRSEAGSDSGSPRLF